MRTERKQPHIRNRIPAETLMPEAVRRENEMKTAFSRAAEEILQNEDRFRKKPGNIKVGLEIEYFILTADFEQAPEALRNKIIEQNPQFTDVELGAAQLEWRTDPIFINKTRGIKQFVDEFISRESQIGDSARNQNLIVLRSGSNPFVKISQIVRTDKEKYTRVPNYHNDNKRYGLQTSIGGNEQVDVRDAAVVSIASSIQCNLEAFDFTDAIDKANRSFAIGPMAVALSGNARFLETKDTGISDVRMIAWEISHDTRTERETSEGAITRIGLPGIYYQNMRDYYQRVSVYPFILYNPATAFPLGIGLNWRDVRIKIVNKDEAKGIEDALVVEFRPVSTQPTAEENLAMMLFALGRLQWSTQHNEPLLDLKLVEENRNQAMHHGLKGQLWTRKDRKNQLLPATDALRLELTRAKRGLSRAGIPAKQVRPYFAILEARIREGKNPSDKLVERVSIFESKGLTRKASLIRALIELGAISKL